MQRWFGKIRHLTTSSSTKSLLSANKTFLNSSPQLKKPVPCLINNSIFKSILNAPSRTQTLDLAFKSFITNPLSLNQSRHFSSKERKRKPGTPEISKLKKYKMKPYSSFKMRFRVMNDGQIRRWRSGKRHNAHLKSKISKRRLRLPALVHPAYATTMKKLNFMSC
ncbi:hypothetical protein MKX03_001374 [Papaver bracteatum]|nr:hypothetical protein MKX03_001374 [Papaver bracteatum]